MWGGSVEILQGLILSKIFVLVSAHVERFVVSSMWDFVMVYINKQLTTVGNSIVTSENCSFLIIAPGRINGTEKVNGECREMQ